MILLMIMGCNIENYTGLPVLGFEDNGTEEVQWTLIGTSEDGLSTPRDLGFNPDNPQELWVVNRDTDSVSLFFEPSSPNQYSENIVDPYALHFMEEVSSIAFGASGTFGTCQESRNTYNNQGAPDDFMGPTLWSSDLEVFGQSNPDAVDYLSDLYGGHVDLGSHLDMLHESPLCMGIAWQFENIYWVFNGQDGSIDRNNFHVDHGMGFDDHSDGTIFKYGIGEFQRVPDVPSHLKYHHDSALLYIADSGNNSIKVLDSRMGDADQRLPVQEPGTDHYEMINTDIWTLINGEDVGMQMPSGLTIVDDILLVTDNQNSKIFAFSLEGELIDTLQTPFSSGALMGIYASSIDDLWLVNAVDNEVWRLQPIESDNQSSATTDEYTSF